MLHEIRCNTPFLSLFFMTIEDMIVVNSYIPDPSSSYSQCGRDKHGRRDSLARAPTKLSSPSLHSRCCSPPSPVTSTPHPAMFGFVAITCCCRRSAWQSLFPISTSAQRLTSSTIPTKLLRAPRHQLYFTGSITLASAQNFVPSFSRSFRQGCYTRWRLQACSR